MLQLCHLLRLRAIAIVSGEAADFDKTALWLRALGAAEVLLDEGSLKASVWGGVVVVVMAAWVLGRTKLAPRLV